MTRKTPRQLLSVEALVCERTGLSIAHVRTHDRAKLLTHAMERAGFSDEAQYVAALRSAPSALLALASELTVGETYFFRDAEQLTFLTDQVLPRLITQRAPDHVLRIWSAGCSSGEEAYTLAMLLAERGWLERAEIVGTDISDAAIARAAAGRYSAWSLRATPQLAKQRYFTPLRNEFQLDAELMRHVRFERQSLIDLDAKLPGQSARPFDLVLCRNVLIYFTPEAQALASQRVAQSLAIGGTLIAGASDHFVELPGVWRREVAANGVSYERIAPVHIVPTEEPERVRARRQHVAARSLPPVRSSAPRRTPRRGLSRPSPATTHDDATALAQVRDVGKREGSARAVEACRAALREQPLATELNLQLVSLLIELDRDREADEALRTLLYVDRNCVMGHWMGAILCRRQNDHVRAARAYRRVATLCAEQPDDTPVPLGEGMTHGALQEVAASEAHSLERAAKSS